MKHFFYLTFFLFIYPYTSWAACEGGYTSLPFSANISEGVISKVIVYPAVYSNTGTCFLNVRVGFGTLKVNSESGTCRITPSVTRSDANGANVNNNMLASLSDCIHVQNNYLKLVYSAMALQQKIETQLDTVGGIDFFGAGMVIQ